MLSPKRLEIRGGKNRKNFERSDKNQTESHEIEPNVSCMILHLYLRHVTIFHDRTCGTWQHGSVFWIGHSITIWYGRSWFQPKIMGGSGIVCLYIYTDWIFLWLVDELFIVFRPARESFTQTSPLPMKGFKKYTRRSGLFSREWSLSCHICCDTGPRLFRFLPKDRFIKSPSTRNGMLRTYSNMGPHR
jgi:hypothetical protein